MTRKEQINSISGRDAIVIYTKLLGRKIRLDTQDSETKSSAREYLRSNKLTPKQAIDAIQR